MDKLICVILVLSTSLASFSFVEFADLAHITKASMYNNNTNATLAHQPTNYKTEKMYERSNIAMGFEQEKIIYHKKNILFYFHHT